MWRRPGKLHCPGSSPTASSAPWGALRLEWPFSLALVVPRCLILCTLGREQFLGSGHPGRAGSWTRWFFEAKAVPERAAS